jgi:hypothetical protein
MGLFWITPNESYIAGNGWGFADPNAINNNLDYIRNQDSVFNGAKLFTSSVGWTGGGSSQATIIGELYTFSTRVGLTFSGSASIGAGKLTYDGRFLYGATDNLVDKIQAIGGINARTATSLDWEGVNANIHGSLSIDYSAAASTTSGASLTFINDASQFSGRNPYTSGVIKSIHTAVANGDKDSTLAFYTHTGGVGGTGALTNIVNMLGSNVDVLKPLNVLDLSAPTFDIVRDSTTIFTSSSIGTINFSGMDGGYQTGASIKALAESNWSAGSFATSLSFYTGSTVLTERMKINPDGSIVIPGSINPTTTTNIGDDLDVAGNINPTTTPTESTVSTTASATTLLPRGNFSMRAFATNTTISIGGTISVDVQKIIDGTWYNIGSALRTTSSTGSDVAIVNLLATYLSSGADMRIVVTKSGSATVEAGVIIRKS